MKQSVFSILRNVARILAARPDLPPSLEDNRLLRTLLERRSVRRFAKEDLGDDAVRAILEAGRLAPCAVNFQTWAFATFTEASWREVWGGPIPFGGRCAILVMADAHRGRTVLTDFPRRPLVEYTMSVINASLAAMAMNVAAEALGVASVMITETGRAGYLDARFLREKLALPDGVIPLLTLVLGRPKPGTPPMPPKLPLDQISFPGRYREADPAVMDGWLAQMYAGFKAEHPGSSLDDQLALYRSRIDGAEEGLRELIFRKDDHA
jgi:nitroreductase